VQGRGVLKWRHTSHMTFHFSIASHTFFSGNCMFIFQIISFYCFFTDIKFLCCFAYTVRAWPQNSIQPFRRRSRCLNSQSYRNVFRTLSVKPTLKSASWIMSRTQTSRTCRTESHHRLRKRSIFLVLYCEGRGLS